MARISGVDIPNNKNIEISLTYVFGIGRNQAQKILKKANIKPTEKTKNVNEKQLKMIQEIIDKDHSVEGDLRKVVALNIKRLKDTGSYRGSRHIKKLPARGQRTKTNSRTRRGNVRTTMTSGRRKTEKT